MPRTPDPQPVNLSGMDKPTLHPERIRLAMKMLRNLMYGPFGAGAAMNEDQVSACETAIAALELIRKSQLAVGLTGQVVDAGRSAMDLLEALKRIGK